MKSIAIILSYAMSVAADEPPTNAPISTMSTGDALTESATPDATLSVVQPSSDSSKDDSFSINEVKPKYDAQTSTDMTALFQQAEILESIKSQLTTANTQCQQVTAQLVAQAHDIDKQVAKFEAQIQVMSIIATGGSLSADESTNSSSYQGLFGAQRLMVAAVKVAAQFAMMAKQANDMYMTTQFGADAATAYTTLVKNQPLQNNAYARQTMNKECADPSALEGIEAFWAAIQQGACNTLTNIEWVNTKMLAYGTPEFQNWVKNNTDTGMSGYLWSDAFLQVQLMELSAKANLTADPSDANLTVLPMLQNQSKMTQITADVWNQGTNFMSVDSGTSTGTGEPGETSSKTTGETDPFAGLTAGSGNVGSDAATVSFPFAIFSAAFLVYLF